MEISNGTVEENNIDHKNEMNKSQDSIADEININNSKVSMNDM